MIKEMKINKKYVRYAVLLLVLLACVLVADAITDADARNSGKVAPESVAELFSIDFRRPIADQLPPCTEIGREFWTMHLTTIQSAAQSQDITIQSVKAVRDGEPEAYSGLAGQGQIVPINLTIVSQDKSGKSETTSSRFRVLMIKGEKGEWLLDGLVVDTK